MTDWDEAERRALDPLERELAEVRARHHGDPPLDYLRAARADVLPDALQDTVAAHLESSAWSRALVDGAERADAALDMAAEDRLLSQIHHDTGATAPRRKTRRVWAPLLVLGTIAAVLVGAVLLWRASVRPTQQSAPTAAQTATPPASPVFALHLAKPDVKLTPAALLTRGEGGGQFVDDVAAGLNAYRAGDYATTARELAAIQPKYPQSIEIPFYLGVSRLFLGDATGAVRALESARALNEPSFAADVEWYLAVAYDRAGLAERSRTLLEGVCNRKGAHAPDACSAIANRR